MTVLDFVPVAVAALIPTGNFLHRRLAWLAQPLRLELAEKGEALLASPDLPKEVRGQVRFMLDTAFEMRGAMWTSVVFFPFVGLITIIFRRDLLARAMRDYSAIPAEQRAKFYEVMRLHDRITTANYPALQMVLELEFLILAMVALLVIAISKYPLPRDLDRSIVVNMMERGESKFFHARAHAH